VVENLPPDFSLESIQEKFGAVGKIVNIIIHDPRSSKESAAPTKFDYILSSKVHALVEYEAVEAAEKAVATLNNERNWRTGMKVKLLAKRNVTGSGKYNQFSKKNQDSTSKKDKKNQPSKEEHDTTLEKKISVDSVESSTDKDNVDSVLTHEDELQHQKSSAKGGRQGFTEAKEKVIFSKMQKNKVDDNVDQLEPRQTIGSQHS
jgi:La-related protein 7